MGEVKCITVNGKTVVYVDVANFNVQKTDELAHILNEAKKVIKAQGEKKARIITNVTNTGFNNTVSNLFKDYAKQNTPYVTQSILVGISGLQKIILTGIKKLTGRDFLLVDTLEQAKKLIK